MNTTADRPPILRFLLIFTVGLAIATGLAAVGHNTAPPAAEEPSQATAKPQA
jgi:hypothetical protein